MGFLGGSLIAKQINSVQWVVDGNSYTGKYLLYGLEDYSDGDTVHISAVVSYGDSGCTDTYEEEVVLKLSSSVDDDEGNKSLRLSKSGDLFKLYPNPTDGILNISVGDDDAVFAVSIYGTNGTLLLSQKCSGAEAQIDVSSLSPSVYLCAVDYNGDSQGKIFKNNK